MSRHFLSDLDIKPAEQAAILARAATIKAHPGEVSEALRGKTLGLLFQKSSTRTRVSFEVGMFQLGGHAIFLAARDNQLGRGESIPDTAQVMSRYVDLMVIRTFGHEDVKALAAHSRVPVINGLDDVWHPCQALADLLTVQEAFGQLQGRKLVYIGDGNNMAHSLMCAGALAGMHVHIVAPKDHAPSPAIAQRAQQVAKHGARISVGCNLDAVAGADVVYTDVWASMGQESEHAARLQSFAGLTVTPKLMGQAAPGAIFMHCLPAHRGEEVASEVIDGAQSRVFEQAENRLHVQKALLLFLSGA